MAENTAPEYDTNDNHSRFIRISPDLQFKVPGLNEAKEPGRLEKALATSRGVLVAGVKPKVGREGVLTRLPCIYNQ